MSKADGTDVASFKQFYYPLSDFLPSEKVTKVENGEEEKDDGNGKKIIVPKVVNKEVFYLN